MAYATSPDVQALNTMRTFTQTSRPSLDDVARYITETAAVLDGILTARGYLLPVPTAATSALELLEHYNAIGAWALSENAAEASPHRDMAAKAWENAQKMLRDGLIEPPGLTKDIDRTRPRGSFAPTAMFTRCLEL